MNMIKRCVRDSYYSYKALFSYYGIVSYTLFKVINALFQVTFFSLFSIYLFGQQDATFWVVGNAFMLSSCNSLFGVGVNATYERIFGTLKYSIVSPTGTISRYFIQMFIHVLDGVLNILLGIVYGILFFGLELSVIQFIQLMGVATIAMISISGLSIFLGNLGLFVRDMTLVLNLVNMLIMICAGVNYPIDTMPVFIRAISKTIPLSRSIVAARQITNNNYTGIGSMLIFELLTGIVYIVLATLCFRHIEKMVIKKARLELI